MQEHRRVEEVMGTVISVVVQGACPAGALDDAFSWFRWVDNVFSPYRADSAVSRIGRGEGSVGDYPVEVGEVLAWCAAIERATGGYFDVHADPRWPLDPSAFVKGWSAEVASHRLSSAGACHHAINAGGDVRVSSPPMTQPWSVGVAHPFLAGELTLAIELADGAVATSGAYERGCHLFDPLTGAAALDLAAVTIVGPDLGLADAYATSALAMGASAAPGWLSTLDGFEAFVVDADGEAWWTPGLASHATGLPG